MMLGIEQGKDNPEDDPTKTWQMVDKFLDAFKQRFRYITCRELTGVDVKTPEGLKKYFENIHDYSCAERVRFAVEKTLEILGERKSG